MMDDDDRQALAQGAARLLAYGVMILAAAAFAGLALRLFQIVSGV